MKVTPEEVVDRQTVLNIELEDDDLDPYLERGYRRVVQQTNIPGFRQGKAPRMIVERYLGREALLQEILDYMLVDATQRAVSEQELDTAGMPRFDALELDPVSFKATVALAPEVELGPYRDIRVEPEPVEITDEDIEANIQELRVAQAVWDPVERPVEMGDMVTVDVEGTQDGQVALKREGQQYVLEADSKQPAPGFAESLVGMVDGQPKEFTLTLPDDYSEETLAGTDLEFSVTLGEIKERILPELDDEFAKGVEGGHESLDALREATKSDLRADAERREEGRFEEAVVEGLMEGATIELAPLLIEHEVEHRTENRKSMLEQMGMRMDDYLKVFGHTEEEVEEETREHAIASLSRGFALSKLAELEGLEVLDEEVEEKLREVQSTQPSRPRNRNRRRRAGDEQESQEAIRESILARKTRDLLTAIARGERSDTEEDPSANHENDEPESGGESNV